MPRHDYVCRRCQQVLREQYRSVAEGGQARCPRCLVCHELMEWIVPRPAFDLRSDGEGRSGETFQKFTFLDHLNRRVEVSSLRQLRQIERESEKMAADGIGQPIRFRGYAQDHSNMSENTFGERPADAPDMVLTPEGKRKFGLRGGAQMIDAREGEPDYSYGPGVNDSNTSALGDA